MAKIETFSVDREDEVYVQRARSLYPAMRFSRLVNMIIKKWVIEEESLRQKQIQRKSRNQSGSI